MEIFSLKALLPFFPLSLPQTQTCTHTYTQILKPKYLHILQSCICWLAIRQCKSLPSETSEGFQAFLSHTKPEQEMGKTFESKVFPMFNLYHFLRILLNHTELHAVFDCKCVFDCWNQRILYKQAKTWDFQFTGNFDILKFCFIQIRALVNFFFFFNILCTDSKICKFFS